MDTTTSSQGRCKGAEVAGTIYVCKYVVWGLWPELGAHCTAQKTKIQNSVITT